jgi:predicted MFS family arabinose efflux permease
VASRGTLRVVREPIVRLLLGAQLLSELGDWAARGALQVLVFERTHSPAWSAAVVAASLAPWVGPGQVLAAFVERLDKRRVMVVSDLARAVLFAAVLIDMPVSLLIVALVVAGLATPIFEANRSVLMRRYTPDELYPAALGLANAVVQISLVVGYVAGGWAVTVVGARGAVLANAASFLTSAVLLLGLPSGDSIAIAGRQALRGAFRVLRGDDVLRWTMMLLLVSAASTVAVEAIVTPYVLDYLGEPTKWVGVSLAAVPLGTLVASTLMPFGTGMRRQLLRGAWVSFGAATLGFVLFLLDPHEPLVLVACAAAGAVLGSLVACNTALGTRIPREVQGTAFSIIQGTLMGVQGLSALAAGIVASWVDERVVSVSAMSIAMVASAALLVARPASRAFRTPPTLSPA